MAESKVESKEFGKSMGLRTSSVKHKWPLVLTVCLLLAAWLFWGHVQTQGGLEFDWSSQDGFRHIDACRYSSKISRAIEAPYCFLVAAQSKRFIAAGFQKAGWTRARGTLAPVQIPFLPIVLGVKLDHFHVIDPTVQGLMRAPKEGDLIRLEQLLAQGAQVNARDQSGRTALMCACTNSAVSSDLLKALFSAGADVNAVDKSGASALHAATWDGVRLVCVRELLAHGANPNLQDNDGDTPLIVAVKTAQNEHQTAQAVAALISGGADPSIRNHFGETALSWAKQVDWKSVVDILTQTSSTAREK